MKKNILIVCTGNSCRSIMAEALLSHHTKDYLNIFSAGSNPTGKINESCLKILSKHNIDTSFLYSKSLDTFKNKNIDIVITVCNNANNEICPSFLEASRKIHFDVNDPSKILGSSVKITKNFQKMFDFFDQFAASIAKICHQCKDHIELTKKIESIYYKNL